MKLATIRADSAATVAVRIDDAGATELGVPDVGAVLSRDDWRSWARRVTGPAHDPTNLSYAPLIVRPGKVVCVGLNYRSHILETDQRIPEYPTLFAKFSTALIGANDDLILPPESSCIDWEAELGVVIGGRGRRVSGGRANALIAGYCVLNDISARDWQRRTNEWLQGKTFEGTTPFGPWLVTPDEVDGGNAEITSASTRRWYRRPVPPISSSVPRTSWSTCLRSPVLNPAT